MKHPEAKRPSLARAAATLWTLAGCGLLVLSYFRFRPFPDYFPIILAASLVTAIVMYRFIFSRVVDINIRRLQRLAPEKDKVCIFAFLNVRGYILIAMMDLLGYTLRHLHVPRLALAPAYTTIGMALLISSVRYFKAAARLAHTTAPPGEQRVPK